MPCPANYLGSDEPKIVKSKAHSAGQVGTFPRDATQLLAILGHPKGVPHRVCGVVAPLDNGTTIPFEPRLPTNPVEHVRTQIICGTGH